MRKTCDNCEWRGNCRMSGYSPVPFGKKFCDKWMIRSSLAMTNLRSEMQTMLRIKWSRVIVDWSRVSEYSKQGLTEYEDEI